MPVYDPANDNSKPLILPRRGKKDQTPLRPGVSPLPNPKRSPLPGTTPTRVSFTEPTPPQGPFPPRAGPVERVGSGARRPLSENTFTRLYLGDWVVTGPRDDDGPGGLKPEKPEWPPHAKTAGG